MPRSRRTVTAYTSRLCGMLGKRKKRKGEEKEKKAAFTHHSKF